MVDHIEHRRGLTFGQAEGSDALPRQLALREISQELTAYLWGVVHASFSRSVGSDRTGYGVQPWMIEPWNSILQVWHVRHEHKFIDEYSVFAEPRLRHLKEIITSGDYIKVFNFLQFLIQCDNCPSDLRTNIATGLIKCRSAYRVIDDLIVPMASDEEAEAVKTALEVARTASARGPYTHLRLAAAHLAEGAMAASVRESISAVEGAAKSIEPSVETLGPALHKLKTSINLNPAMSTAFSKLYGWTSDAKGIRHANVFEGVADVTERDAMFMFGACASFVSYLLSASK